MSEEEDFEFELEKTIPLISDLNCLSKNDVYDVLAEFMQAIISQKLREYMPVRVTGEHRKVPKVFGRNEGKKALILTFHALTNLVTNFEENSLPQAVTVQLPSSLGYLKLQAAKETQVRLPNGELTKVPPKWYIRWFPGTKVEAILKKLPKPNVS